MNGKYVVLMVAVLLFSLCSGGAQQSSSEVRYIPSSQAASIFAKGGTLVQRESGNYMVMAAHRDKDGEVEVHKRDTDIIYVVQGSAALVTGGSVTAPRETSPDEVRGPAISGGETRQLSKGDVIVIPPNVPHWFTEVKAPFDYFVVKVR